jgi:hypothetical protein
MMNLGLYTVILLYGIWAGFAFRTMPNRGVNMARRTASKGPLTTGRRQQGRAKAQPLDDAYGVPVPAALHEAIEMERDNLSKAEALLACLIVSMEYANDPVSGPYYPAVAQIARELVERSINSLDPFELRQRLLRNKIEEEFCVAIVGRRYSLPHPASSSASAHRLAA